MKGVILSTHFLKQSPNQKLAASLSTAFLKDVSIDQEHNSSILETETAGSAFLPIQFQVSY
jgi:hypothetical protein